MNFILGSNSTIVNVPKPTVITKENKTDAMCNNIKDWGKSYSEKHGYISIAVCIFGIVANLLNILVLTRKEMNASPINKILAGKYSYI